MRYRRVGNTDLSLSEIGFGCGGNAGLMVRGEAREQISAVERALALGVTYFDNAPDYGGGLAEENLGHALKVLGAKPIVNSKVEIRAENLGDIRGHVVRSAERSLKRLGIEQLDIFQVHNGPASSRPTLKGQNYRQLWLDDYMRPEGVCEAIDQLKAAGKIRHAGFICRGDDADAVATLLDTGMFALLNVPYTLLNPTAGFRKPDRLEAKDFGNVFEIAERRGVGAAIYSPLAGGFLADTFVRGEGFHPLARRADSQSPMTQIIAARVARLAFLPNEGESLAQAAYRFILSHPAVTTVIGGFSSIEQLDELATVSDGLTITPAKMARFKALWENNFEA